ncbi:MAG TPA: cupin domain-containing protein [Planctomycetia bacterium]|nr:cupin domain-containing protein [Planctomycetia bacterium]
MSAVFLSDLVAAAPPPPTGMTSRKIFEDEQVRTIVFGFAAGAELPPHVAPRTVMLQFLQGEAAVGIGDETHEVRAGHWLHLPAGVKHSLAARSPTVMLLLMLK